MTMMEYNTPCYVIDMEKFRKNWMAMKEPFEARWDGKVEYGYSVKTNHESALMRYASEKLGWYIETVSPYEYDCARTLVEPERIIFNGPCKGERLTEVLEKGGVINLDHMVEVEEVCCYASEKKRTGTWSGAEIGLRLNFDLEKLCPGETTAGDSVIRFGICYENGDFGRAVEMLRTAGIEPAGIHLHTSTKSRSEKVFRMLARKAAEVIKEYGMKLSYVDMGGGFFGGQKVLGKPEMKDYAAAICEELCAAVQPEETRLILEPGASVIATSVTYLSRVINVRDVRGVRVVTLDGTLLHINPFMSHRAQPYELCRKDGGACKDHPADRAGHEKVAEQIVCGSTCMENDRFFTEENQEAFVVGDILRFKAAGAYTMAFNSEFILQPPRVYVINE